MFTSVESIDFVYTHTHVCWGMPKPSNSGNIIITYNHYFNKGGLTLIVDCYSVWAGPSIYWDIYIYIYVHIFFQHSIRLTFSVNGHW